MCKKGGLLTAHKSGVNLPFLGYKCLLINKNMEHSYVKIVLVCHIKAYLFNTVCLLIRESVYSWKTTLFTKIYDHKEK